MRTRTVAAPMEGAAVSARIDLDGLSADPLAPLESTAVTRPSQT